MIRSTSLAAIHAYLCGDGCVIRPPIGSKYTYRTIDFRNIEMTLLRDFQKKYREVFKERPHITAQKDRCRKGSVKTYNRLIQRFESFHSRSWRVPTMTKKCASAWCRAFFDCEGWVTYRVRIDRTIGLDSVHLLGLRQVQQLLLDEFQISSTVREKTGKDIWTMRICGKDDLVKFRKHVGFLHPRKSASLDAAIESYEWWRWKFPEGKRALRANIRRVLRENAREKKGAIRVFSRKENLENLKNALRQEYRIKTVLRQCVNGNGTTYYELALYGKNQINEAWRIAGRISRYR